MKTVTVLRHVHFEDLGSLAPVLGEFGYDITYRSVGDANFLSFYPLAPDLVIILGGPIGVYEDDLYPFLSFEKELLKERLGAELPTLGICLGAQLIAAALGAKVYPSGHKEIGFGSLLISDAGLGGPLRHLTNVPVLHWHGDTYDLPAGAIHLAASPLVHQQAFAIGDHVLGLQFHAEVDARTGFERWLVGHASELAGAGIDVAALRRDAVTHGGSLVAASDKMFREWLGALPA